MIVAVTELHVRSFWKFFSFLRLAIGSLNQAKKAEGCIHASTTGKGWRIGYSLTAWKDRETMMKYRNSGIHKVAMQRISRVSKKYRTLAFEAGQVPDWKTAKQKLEEVPFKVMA